MQRLPIILTLGALALALGGCIVEDRLTTLTIHADGSADMLVYCVNTHSTQKGDAGNAEISEYQRKFNERESEPFVQIEKAGGRILRAEWIQKKAPLASLVHAELPDSDSLKRWAQSFSNEDFAKVTGHWSQNGTRRTFAIRFALQESVELSPPDEPTNEQKKIADAISEFRFAVSEGKIESAKGLKVAGDRQSALLDIYAIMASLAEERTTEVSLTWNTAP